MHVLLEEANDDTWPAIRKLLQRETKSAIAGLSSAISAFDIDQMSKDKMLSDIGGHAINIVESKAKEESLRVLFHMKER